MTVAQITAHNAELRAENASLKEELAAAKQQQFLDKGDIKELREEVAQLRAVARAARNVQLNHEIGVCPDARQVTWERLREALDNAGIPEG